MHRNTRRRSRKTGLPPGSLVHVGEVKTEKTRIAVIRYDQERFEELQVQSLEEPAPWTGEPGVTWIDVVGIHEAEIIEAIGVRLGIHPLVLEDIMNSAQRPKVDDFGDYLFAVLRALSFEAPADGVRSDQVSLLVGADFVVSFQETESGVFDPVRERIRNGKGKARNMGTDYLAYALIDSVVDRYFLVMEKMADEIDLLEDEILTNPMRTTLGRVQRLRDGIIYLRRSIWPLREVASRLERGDSPLISHETGIYFRDVYEHTIEVMDTLDTFRDILSGMFDIYLSSVSNRLNEVMKVLTIIATLFMPLSFIASLYGMNFEYIPELKWHYGYFMVLGVMFIAAISMLTAFRKKKWL